MAAKVAASKGKRDRTALVAGGENGSAKKAQKTSKGRADEQDAANLPMGKALASTEKSVRDGAIRSLASYLSQTNAEPLSDAELARLWKGIYYCFWMSDKPRVQQALAQELADMLLDIKIAAKADTGASASSSAGNTSEALYSDAAFHFLEGFFDAMVREWWSLDKWRVDKFMMLVRRFINGAFRLIAQGEWNDKSVQRFTGMLTKQGGALCANDIKSPDGLMYHICDIYLDELEKVCALQRKQGREASTIEVPVHALVLPFINVAAQCHASHHFDRIMKAVIDPYLDDCIIGEVEKEEREEEGADWKNDDDEEGASECEYPALLRVAQSTPTQLRKDAFKALFDAASQSTSVEARRRRIYKMCKDEEDRLEDEED